MYAFRAHSCDNCPRRVIQMLIQFQGKINISPIDSANESIYQNIFSIKDVSLNVRMPQSGRCWDYQFNSLSSALVASNGICWYYYLIPNRGVMTVSHDDVIKWKHFPRNWPFVRKIHRSPVNFPHKGQCRGSLMFSLIYVWINDWANNREAGDLRRQHGHYDVIVMWKMINVGICIIKTRQPIFWMPQASPLP